jgi:ABC-2 type transport system ATP-binding protein
MLDLLAAMRGRGHTTLMATHYLDEAEHLCDRIGVLFDGRLAAETDAATLRAPGRSARITVAGLPAELAAHLEQLSPAVRSAGAEITIEPNTPELQARVVRALLDAGVAIIALEPRGRPLEELYLRVVRGEPQPPVSNEDRTTLVLDGRDIPQPPPGPARPGDTLLRELLRQENQREDREE